MRGLGLGIILTTLILSFQTKGNQVVLTDDEIISAAKNLGMVMPESVKIDYNTIRDNLNQQVAGNDEQQVGETNNQNINENELNQDNANQNNTNQDNVNQENNQSTGTTNGSSTDSTNGSTTIDSITDGNSESESDAQAGTGEGNDQANLDHINSDNTSSENDSSNDTEENPIQIHHNYVVITVTPGMYTSDVTKLLEAAEVIDDRIALNQYLSQNGYSTEVLSGSHKIPYGATYSEIAKILIGED